MRHLLNLTYNCVVDEKVGVEAEGDGDRDEADDFVHLDLALVPPRQLFDIDPVGDLGDQTFALAFLATAALGSGGSPRTIVFTASCLLLLLLLLVQALAF